MKSLLAIALSLFALPLAAVTFGRTPLAVGSAWTETGQYGSEVKKQESLVQRTKRISVTALNGDAITGFNVEYTSVKINGRDVTSTFAGKLYTLTVNGNHVLRITNEDGGNVPTSESGFVQTDNSDIAQTVEMTRTFAGQDVATGTPLAAKNAAALYDVQSGFAVDKFSMTLSSVSGDIATFDVMLQVSAGTSMTMSLAGQLHASVAKGHILDMSLRGPVSTGGQTMTATLSKTFTY